MKGYHYAILMGSLYRFRVWQWKAFLDRVYIEGHTGFIDSYGVCIQNSVSNVTDLKSDEVGEVRRETK